VPAGRRRGRECAVQIVYLAEGSGVSPIDAADEYFSSDLCRKEAQTSIVSSFADLARLAESVGRKVPHRRRYSLGGSRPSAAAEEYARRLAGIVDRLGPALDEAISVHLQDWKMERLGGVERALLRVSGAEILSCLDVPGVVIIDEAVEIAKNYCGEESHGLINGVLDALLRKTVESGARPSPKGVSSGEG